MSFLGSFGAIMIFRWERQFAAITIGAGRLSHI
jgi:hypothetical protein